MFEPIVLLAVMTPMAVHLMVLVQPLLVMPPKGSEVLLPKKSHLKKRKEAEAPDRISTT